MHAYINTSIQNISKFPFIMKSYFLLLFFLPTLIFAQELSPPQISVESGFYQEDLQVDVTHPNSAVMLLYTLDGSEPNINNIYGKEWNYKTEYPLDDGNNLGQIKKDTIWTFEYLEPINISDRTPEETILANVSTAFINPNVNAEGSLFKGNVLRVRAYSEDNEEYSKIITRNYFVSSEENNQYSVPVVALSFDNDLYYGYESGIGVPGILFDNYRQENPSAPIDGWAPANYRVKGKSTEILVHFNYFENGEEILDHHSGLRINGGYTRAYPNKSLRLYARNDYGKKNFKHHFFEGYEINKFKRLLLRNSGNDSKGVFFRDAFMHRMARNLSFDIQESQPVALIINGEYNGLRNIRERYDKKYFKRIHDIPENDLDFLENSGEMKNGDDLFYQEMIDFFENNSLEDNTVLELAFNFLDPINYTDYYATNIYVANVDWPDGNYLYYRHKTTYDPTEDLGTKDGRFRWLLKDLDWGFYLRERDQTAYEANTLQWATRDIPPTLIMRKLLENQNYREFFITRFADLLNTTFKENRVTAIIDEFENLYESEIEENGRRWNNHTSDFQYWNADVNRMKTFAQNRPEFQREHLIEMFDLEGLFDLALNISNEDHGHIKLNTIDIQSTTDGINENTYPWVGEYFKNIPITLTAIPKEGYVFSHWSGAVDSADTMINLELNEDTYIKANFIEDDMNIDNEKKHEIVLYPNPNEGIVHIKSEADWQDFKIYNLQGRQVQSGKISNNSIEMYTLDSDIYFLHLKTTDGIEKRVQVVKK